jgi:uncharacterized membrane protein
MSQRLFIARLFLTVGGLLVVGGLILWFALPIRPMFPPYLVTGVLALGYGTACRWRGPFRAASKP